jgi:hypothetical protein
MGYTNIPAIFCTCCNHIILAEFDPELIFNY